MNIRAVIEWDEETKAFSATCPELNFISSWGETRAEAINHLKDAIRLMLEPRIDDLSESQISSEIVELVL